MNERENEQFAEKARELFDDSVERLDAAALSQLNQGRHRALEEIARAGPYGRWLRWVPVTGVAAAAVIAVVVVNAPVVTVTDEPVTATDFEMLLEEDSLEMFEDLEFFSLLDAIDLEAGADVG